MTTLNIIALNYMYVNQLHDGCILLSPKGRTINNLGGPSGREFVLSFFFLTNRLLSFFFQIVELSFFPMQVVFEFFSPTFA